MAVLNICFDIARGYFARKTPPKPFFEILYLDDDLRVHKTGQGNVFVQEGHQGCVCGHELARLMRKNGHHDPLDFWDNVNPG